MFIPVSTDKKFFMSHRRIFQDYTPLPIYIRNNSFMIKAIRIIVFQLYPKIIRYVAKAPDFIKPSVEY